MRRTYRTTRRVLSGTIWGYLWLPAVPAYKTFSVELGTGPFKTEWEGLKDTLWGIHLREGGDFQGPLFGEVTLSITRVSCGATAITRTRHRRFNAENAGGAAYLFHSAEDLEKMEEEHMDGQYSDEDEYAEA